MLQTLNPLQSLIRRQSVAPYVVCRATTARAAQEFAIMLSDRIQSLDPKLRITLLPCPKGLAEATSAARGAGLGSLSLAMIEAAFDPIADRDPAKADLFILCSVRSTHPDVPPERLRALDRLILPNDKPLAVLDNPATAYSAARRIAEVTQTILTRLK